MTLPVTTPPTQVPQIASAGIAMSPYVRSADYSATAVRDRILWIELAAPPANPQDQYFARVLRTAPDPLLTTFSTSLPDIPEPPLAIDPEWARLIVEGQADDKAGLNAMQTLIPSDSKLYYGLPLPPGLNATSLELFGFFTYELRVGHFNVWSTAQGRFGPPLRVTGVQQLPPPMVITAVRTRSGLLVGAPFAVPVLNGVPCVPRAPKTAIWVMLYAQTAQIDGADTRNVLLTQVRAGWRDTQRPTSCPFGEAQFSSTLIAQLLTNLGFPTSAPLSVLAVELLPQATPPVDPLGANLGSQRILRTSPLTPVTAVC